MLPFLGGLIWAATVVIATWPLLLRVRARTGKRQWLATVFMTGVILLVLIVPFAMAVSTLLDVLHSGPEFLGEYFKNGLGPAPGVAWQAFRPWATSWWRSGMNSRPAAAKD